MIHACMFLKRYSDYATNISERTRIVFPRLIFINKEWTLRQAHFEIFKFIKPILLKYEEKSGKNASMFEDKNDQELFNLIFKNFGDKTDVDTVDNQKKRNYPYRIRLKNVAASEICYFCEKNCNDCVLPMVDDVKLGDLLGKIPKRDDMEIDNTYLYLKENYRNYAIKNRDFQFELTFLPQYHDAVKTLNEFNDKTFNLSKSTTSKAISICDCFKNFCKLEVLKENNEWFCPQCKKHQKAKKKMEIYNASNILIIHLKRFNAHSKIDSLVDFPINDLNISNYVLNKSNNDLLLYDLFAISNHFGGLGGGHYIAYAKNYLNQEWYEFNDSSVHKISEDSLVTSSAYVLFYRRKKS